MKPLSFQANPNVPSYVSPPNQHHTQTVDRSVIAAEARLGIAKQEYNQNIGNQDSTYV